MELTDIEIINIIRKEDYIFEISEAITNRNHDYIIFNISKFYGIVCELFRKLIKEINDIVDNYYYCFNNEFNIWRNKGILAKTLIEICDVAPFTNIENSKHVFDYYWIEYTDNFTIRAISKHLRYLFTISTIYPQAYDRISISLDFSKDIMNIVNNLINANNSKYIKELYDNLPLIPEITNIIQDYLDNEY